MKKKRLCLFLVIVVFITLLSSVVYAESGDYIVYITKSGTKYHRGTCSYLKSKYEITLGEATSLGYTPCSRCNPPRLDNAPKVTATPKPQPTQRTTAPSSSSNKQASSNPPYIVVGPVSTPAPRAPSSSSTQSSSSTTRAVSGSAVGAQAYHKQTDGKAFTVSPFGFFTIIVVTIYALAKVSSPRKKETKAAPVAPTSPPPKKTQPSPQPPKLIDPIPTPLKTVPIAPSTPTPKPTLKPASQPKPKPTSQPKAKPTQAPKPSPIKTPAPIRCRIGDIFFYWDYIQGRVKKAYVTNVFIEGVDLEIDGMTQPVRYSELYRRFYERMEDVPEYRNIRRPYPYQETKRPQ